MKNYTQLKSFILVALVLFLLQESANAQDPNFHIYLCFGQSNMAGAGDIETQDQTVDSRFQFMKPQDCASENEYAGNWYDAVPPLWGCTGGIGPSDYFGRTMVQNLPTNVKVGVVVVGIPGCKIELFGKTGYAGYDTYNYVPSQYNGSAYAWLLDLAKKAQKDGVIKGFLLHQGESNTGDKDWPNKVKAVYDNLITDLSLNASETPLLAGEMLYQDQGGACWGHNAIIATLPNTLANSYVISSKDLPGKDQYHFTSAGNRTLGTRFAEQMLSLIPDGPSVNFTSPTKVGYASPATVSFDVEASTTSGTISHINFYINDETSAFHEESSAPYDFEWTFDQPGLYKIKAVAYDDAGNTGEDITTISVQGAYAVQTIPGTIEFENFDIGGNGYAYYDESEGNDAAIDFRTDDDVDIEACSDTGGGYNIGYATAGEWLEYTVNVETAGTYDLAIRAAGENSDRTISLSANGTDIATDILMPNTGGWQKWKDTLVENILLDAGEQVIRLTIGANSYINLNYMTFALHGMPAEPMPLKIGWNLIGCTIDSKAEIATALSSIWEYVESVKSDDAFYSKSQPAFLNSLDTLEWGMGYAVYVSQNCELNW